MIIHNLAFGVVWENDAGEQFEYTINVSEDEVHLEAQTANFQRGLWYWLGGTGLILLLAQWWVLRWSLRPLNKAAKDLDAIESGQHARLSGSYPIELQQLTRNINRLLDHEQHRRLRYKNSLADLAHSLKTPLAVLRSEVENSDDLLQLKSDAQEQLDRLSHLVDYQLQRAATEGKNNLLAPVSLGEIIHKIITSLDKVYQQKRVRHQLEIERDAFIHADQDDMYELLGNLLENAYKYCRSQVNIIVRLMQSGILLKIEDDGAGLPIRSGEAIIKRGRRFDSQQEGHGLGLAIASDIVEAYEGTIELEKSYLGGACFVIKLPNQ
ncbi:Sensor protein PhoQ [Methylophaga frappieri]|uniref:histidine kinase n=2 Tax=Methylophaga frappieri (strain ATCC BAA-2434 / DSM 25690 / JAM7) TaxID=754477 RepID=I1YE79_METFJ|nr:Sensor protein PhoQ [Methylophaga frappieri]